MITRIHIARDKLESGEPAIVVEQGSLTSFAYEIEIKGSTRIVQNPKGMPATGGRRKQIKCWVETDDQVWHVSRGDANA